MPIIVDSYLVKKCPMYVPDAPRHTTRIDPNRVSALMCGICERAIRDYAESVIKYRAANVDYKTKRLNNRYDMRYITARDFIMSPFGEEMFAAMRIRVSGEAICKKIEEDPQGVLNRFYDIYHQSNQERSGATRTIDKYQNALKRAERN